MEALDRRTDGQLVLLSDVGGGAASKSRISILQLILVLGFMFTSDPVSRKRACRSRSAILQSIAGYREESRETRSAAFGRCCYGGQSLQGRHSRCGLAQVCRFLPPVLRIYTDLLGRAMGPNLCSTLHAALSFFADSLDRTAQEHMSFSEVLTIQVADDLKALSRKKEETRKKVHSELTIP